MWQEESIWQRGWAQRTPTTQMIDTLDTMSQQGSSSGVKTFYFIVKPTTGCDTERKSSNFEVSLGSSVRREALCVPLTFVGQPPDPCVELLPGSSRVCLRVGPRCCCVRWRRLSKLRRTAKRLVCNLEIYILSPYEYILLQLLQSVDVFNEH